MIHHGRVVMICPALAWLVMRFAVCTAEPKISRFSRTTGPKLQPMRIATVCSSTFSPGCSVICFCIWAAAFSASSAVAKVAMTSSPMVLMTVPPFWSVAARITSMQMPDHIARAQVAKQLIELGTADDVGKHDGEFDFLSHVPRRIILNRTACARAV